MYTTNITAQIFVFVVVVICLITIYSFCRIIEYKTKVTTKPKPKIDIDLNSTITKDKGWVHLNWNKAIRSREIQEFSSLTILNPKDWGSICTKDWFIKFHYMTPSEVLTLSYNLHTNTSLNIQDIVLFKRQATANAIIFNFKLPQNLWLLDPEVLQNVIMYNSFTELINFNIKTYNQSEFKEATLKEIKDFELLILGIPYGMNYIVKLISNNKSPNIYYLSSLVEKNDLKFWELLEKDNDNLKRVMTMCYCLAGLMIPNDYILIDENVYCFLLNKSPSRKVSKNLLTVVK